MQVSVEKLEGLERRLTVQVPAAKINDEVQSRLQDLSRRVRLDGFRPGKVPFKVVKRMYGSQVRQEVMGELLQSSFQDALTQEQLRPAGMPKFEPKQMGEGESLEYSATFEVFPEFEPQGAEGIKVERPVAEIADADINRMLETLRKQRRTWHDVERAAQTGDRVTINFEGTLDGESFPGGKGEQVPVVLGEGAMLEDFEKHLLGRSAGDEASFDLTFPETYPNKDLAGKTVQFTVNVGAVAEANLPEVNDEFAAGFDIEEGGVDALRAALRETMERELGEGIKNVVKRQIMQSLLDANSDISVPQSMVKEEIDNLARQAGLPEKTEQDAQALKARLFEQEARRRVVLGLIVGRLVALHGIKLDNMRVYERIQTIASQYQEEDAKRLLQMYQQNPQAMDSIRNAVIEDQMVDWLLERAEVTEKPSSFDEIMRPGSTQAENSVQE